MKIIIALLFVALIGCGNHTKVKYHEVSPQELASMSGSDTVLGMAKWKDLEFVVYCDIYIMPADIYETQTCYDAVVKHELRHCYEFHFHSGRDEFPNECHQFYTITQNFSIQ
jgi:hypothetical protein